MLAHLKRHPIFVVIFVFVSKMIVFPKIRNCILCCGLRSPHGWLFLWCKAGDPRLSTDIYTRSTFDIIYISWSHNALSIKPIEFVKPCNVSQTQLAWFVLRCDSTGFDRVIWCRGVNIYEKGSHWWAAVSKEGLEYQILWDHHQKQCFAKRRFFYCGTLLFFGRKVCCL